MITTGPRHLRSKNEPGYSKVVPESEPRNNSRLSERPLAADRILDSKPAEE